jgi:hypothetical protein
MNPVIKRNFCMAVCQFLLSVLLLNAEEELDYKRRQTAVGFFLLQHQMMLAFYRQSRITIRRRRTRQRSCWMKPRSSDWWNRIVQHHFSDDDWIENFRVSSATFKFLCSRLRTYLEPDNHSVREPATVEKKVAIALFYINWLLVQSTEWSRISLVLTNVWFTNTYMHFAKPFMLNSELKTWLFQMM